MSMMGLERERCAWCVSDQGTSGSGNARGRTLAGEVVAQMLRSIADDRRLLEPVRELVLQLKPALLHLAKTDPRFLSTATTRRAVCSK